MTVHRSWEAPLLLPGYSIAQWDSARSLRDTIVTDEQLIRRCARQDRDAQHALYERHANPLYRLALRLTGNAEDAADALQEAFVKALTNLDKFAGRSSPATWLYRIAVNEALQIVRKRQNAEQKLRRICATDRERDKTDGVDAQLDLDTALAELADQDRAILLLRYQQDLSYAEIAEVLDLAAGTVASRLNRARARLRVRLEGDRTDGD